MHLIFVRFLMLAVLAASAALSHATILTFDQERDSATGALVGPTTSGGRLRADYGDNVTGAAMAVPGGVFTYGEAGEGFTPHVSVDIFSATATASDAGVRLWQTGYGDLVNVLFGDGPGTAGAPLLGVRFTAAPGYMVDLYGFELAGFGSDYVIAGVSVFAGSVSLFSQNGVLVQGDAFDAQRTSIAFAMPLSAPELLLQVDLSNLSPGIRDNVGLDSIRFGQTPPPPVPEPTSALLLLAGLGLTATACRWRRRARRSAWCEQA